MPSKTLALLKPGTYVTLPIDEPLDDPRNENLHTPEDIEGLAILYKTYGQQVPIVIMPDRLIKRGHGWREGMKKAGAKTIDCRVSELKGVKADGFRISDNVAARKSDFDPLLFDENVAAIRAKLGAKFDPTLLGYDAETFAKLTESKSAPSSFPLLNDTPTDFQCPKCNYEWSGKPKPSAEV